MSVAIGQGVPRRSEARRHLYVWRRLVGARARAQLQYRGSLALNIVGSASVTFLDFFEILFIFNQVPALAGWSVNEVAFLYAVSGISFSITDLLIGHLDYLGQMIKSGTMDSFLVRPVGTLTQVISADFSLRRLGKALQCVGVLVWAVVRLDIPWDPARVGMVVVMIVSGVAIFWGVWVTFAAITFWTVDSIELVNSFTYGGNYMTQHPLGVFGRWLRRFLAFVVPLAFVNYFPSVYILGRDDPLGFPAFVRFLSPIVAVATLLVSRAAWGSAVRHYRSTGS